LFRYRSVTRSHQPFHKETPASANQRANQKRRPRHLENALRNDKRLEWDGKWSRCRNDHAGERVFLHKGTDPSRRAALCFSVIALTAFSRQPVDAYASRQRAERSHCGVVGHARRMLARKFYQQQVRDERKGEQRAINESRGKEPKSPQQ